MDSAMNKFLRSRDKWTTAPRINISSNSATAWLQNWMHFYVQ